MMKITTLHPQVGASPECMNLSAELCRIFSPMPALFIASLVAYVTGQYADIFIFSKLKKIFAQKRLMLRSGISMACAAFLDNCVFSLLAWVVLAKEPVSLSSLWNTYIFITYIMRLAIAGLCIPLVKFSGNFVEKKKDV
jgi:uncharacterized integral membrane protein (TIGR00697 family)